jgi:hypothetical protein
VRHLDRFNHPRTPTHAEFQRMRGSTPTKCWSWCSYRSGNQAVQATTATALDRRHSQCRRNRAPRRTSTKQSETKLSEPERSVKYVALATSLRLCALKSFVHWLSFAKVSACPTSLLNWTPITALKGISENSIEEIFAFLAFSGSGCSLCSMASGLLQ